jgi:para-aminobenzoate synthetase component 1
MIVDLMRNDLSKTCADDSIEVSALCACESFARVHHLVSTVRGRLRPECHALDLARACFPGGSITGAPKIRAMEIIAALERRRRGPYCGAIGYIGADGAMDLNIAIRTLIYEGRGVSFSVGGGITAASDPAAEYAETLAKASAIFASFAPERQQEEAAA